MGIKVWTSYTRTAKQIRYQKYTARVWQELKHREQIVNHQAPSQKSQTNITICKHISRQHHEI